jgi:hypothetical protein
LAPRSAPGVVRLARRRAAPAGTGPPRERRIVAGPGIGRRLVGVVAPRLGCRRTLCPQPHGPTAVIALGGNALAPSGARSTITDQFQHTRESLAPVVDLAREGWRLCVVHGNGPQVGDELLRNEAARAEASPLPLGVLVAATAGWIGYMIQQSLENALRAAGSPRTWRRSSRRSRSIPPTRRSPPRRSSSATSCSPRAPPSSRPTGT